MESGIGWREWFMLAAVVAGIYLLVALMALARLRRRTTAPPAIEPADFGASAPFRSSEVPPGQAWEHPFRTPAPLPPKEPEPIPMVVDLLMEDAPGSSAVPDPGREPPAFAAALAVSGLEAEVRQLRAEVSVLREELDEIKAARRISPLYADAAALAHRGFDARGVAEECGISVAEAELVLAMSKDEKNFDSEVRDGTDGNR